MRMFSSKASVPMQSRERDSELTTSWRWLARVAKEWSTWKKTVMDLMGRIMRGLAGSKLETLLQDDASTPTASSWVSSLPPSVPSNTLNDVESVRRDLSAVDEVQSIGLASSSSELSAVGHEQTPAKTFSEEGCQVELIVENAPVSDHRLKERLILMLDLSCLLA